MSDQSQEILRLQSELARLQEEGLRKDRKIEQMQSVIDSLRNMMAYFRKRDYSGLNVPLVAVCNVPPIAFSNVPPQKWLL